MTNKIILTKQNIINTYNERQQNHCKIYYRYKKINKKTQN